MVSHDALQNDVIDLVRFRSGRPYDGWTRTRLSKILSSDVAGNLGLPIIASVALAFGKTPHRGDTLARTVPGGCNLARRKGGSVSSGLRVV